MTLQEILPKVSELIKTIPTNYDTLLTHLKKAEGGYLHYNSKEVDITTGYGIYRNMHPKALIFEYIDMVAKKHTTEPSVNWRAKSLLDAIDASIDSDTERYLTYLFYHTFLKPANLELFVEDMVMVMVNLYTNSPKGAWMSIQEGLRDMSKDGILPIPLEKLSRVDGAFGNVTKNALEVFANGIKTETPYERVLINKLFRKSVLLAMKSFYTNLTASNPEKFVGVMKGWDNRIEELEHI